MNQVLEITNCLSLVVLSLMGLFSGGVGGVWGGLGGLVVVLLFGYILL